jgi:L-ascorbate metabolism protein UlaG (beta-lactamase superfamily)
MLHRCLIFLFLLISFNIHAKISYCWSGVAGIYMTDGETGLFFDPVFNRPGILDIVLQRDYKLDHGLIEESLQKCKVKNLKAIFTSHTHFDHAIDAPIVSKMTGAKLYGSKTLKYLSLSHGVEPSKIVEAPHGFKVQVGKFTITVIKSAHGKILGFYEYLGGELLEKVKTPINISHYKMGGAFSYLIEHEGKNYFFQQATRYTPELKAAIKDKEFEVFFQGLGNRRSTKDLADNIWKMTKKINLIVPVHHDNFFFPLSDGMQYLWFVKYDEFLNFFKENKNYKVNDLKWFETYEY